MSMEDLIEISDFVAIREAIKSGRDINSVDRYYRRTALMAAVSDRDQSMVEWLIEHGANVNQQDKLGWTALHFAAQEGNVAIVDLLLKNKAKVDFVDIHGNSPLARAIMSCPHDTVKQIVNLFLAHHADPKVQNFHGVSAFDVAPELFNS